MKQLVTSRAVWLTTAVAFAVITACSDSGGTQPNLPGPNAASSSGPGGAGDTAKTGGKRDSSGVLQPDPAKFPDMKGLADYVHGLGLKIGIYSSPGPDTCEGYEGSYGHEQQDARTYAAWGIDYLKYDWCGAFTLYKDSEMQAVYQKMGDALLNSGRAIVFSLCQYGLEDVWKWGSAAGGNLWRTAGDISDSWDAISRIGFSQDRFAHTPGPDTGTIPICWRSATAT